MMVIRKNISENRYNIVFVLKNDGDINDNNDKGYDNNRDTIITMIMMIYDYKW